MFKLISEFRKELISIAGFAESTVENYISCIIMFNEYSKTQFHISALDATGKHILSWISKLREQGLSYSRIDHHRSALKNFFAMLIKLNIVRKNPAESLPPLRKKSLGRIKPVCSRIVFKLLNTVDRTTWRGNRNYMIISTLWALGPRISELTSLTVESFEPNHVPKNKIGLLRVKGKNKKERALFVVERLYKNLVSYLAHPESPKQKQDSLFPLKNGKPLSSNRIQKKFKEYCKDAGIKEHLTPHVLRHSFATEMYHQKVPLDAIQAMMGHDKIEQTAVYIKVENKVQKKALGQLTINGSLPWE